MPCYRPIQAHSEGIKPNGKMAVAFNRKEESNSPNAFKIPCGTCIGCSLDKARQWSIRCVHEAMFHEQSCFITLTYRNEDLPQDGSVKPRPFQLFMKRLRKRTGRKIRYFHCGEYGPKFSRPHYHAIIFGYSFPDRELFKEQPFKWYRSQELEELWPHGFSTVCDLTEASASYVARYTLKKVYGKQAKQHYGSKHPEYVTMSRMPGIGHSWYQAFKTDIYPHGVYERGGFKQAPPKYYDRLYGQESPELLAKLKRKRKMRAQTVTATDTINGKLVRVSNSDSFRLPVRESVKLSQISALRRSYEEK